MATYRGIDGSMTYATSSVAELLAWRITGVELAFIEDTVKGDSAKTFKVGLPDPGIVTADVYIDSEATGQTAWLTSVLAGTGSEVAFVCLVDTAKTYTFNAIPSGAEIESPEGDSSISRATLTAKISGTITIAWT